MDARSPSFSCSGERRRGAAWSAVIGRRLLPGPRPWGVCYLNDGAKAGPAPVGRLHYGIERPSLPTRPVPRPWRVPRRRGRRPGAKPGSVEGSGPRLGQLRLCMSGFAGPERGMRLLVSRLPSSSSSCAVALDNSSTFSLAVPFPLQPLFLKKCSERSEKSRVEAAKTA